MSRPLDGVRRIDEIEDSGPLVVLAGEVDLDLLMMELAAMGVVDEFDGRTWEDFRDEPTQIWSAYGQHAEPQVGWFRKQPCRCGGIHRWDIEPVNLDDRPTGKARYGAFLAVYFA
jgi:hypothetical protein